MPAAAIDNPVVCCCISGGTVVLLGHVPAGDDAHSRTCLRDLTASLEGMCLQ